MQCSPHVHIHRSFLVASLVQVYAGYNGRTRPSKSGRRHELHHHAPLSCRYLDSCQCSTSRLWFFGALSCPRRGVLCAHHSKCGSVCCTLELRTMLSAARSSKAEELKKSLASLATITGCGGMNWLKKWNAARRSVEEAVSSPAARG